jgi:hypothetical protein
MEKYRLVDEVNQTKKEIPALRDDNAFVLWFLRAFLADSEESAKSALTGQTGDKNLDAILIDENAKQVHLVQGKYHQSPKAEKRNDVLAFADWATVPWDERSIRAAFYCKLAPLAQKKMDVAINRIKQRGYDLRLYFVTTGTVSPTIRNDAEYKVCQVSQNPQIQILDNKRVHQIFHDYVYGIAPAVPTLFLRISESGPATTEGVHHRFDPSTKIESWVFSMAAEDVGNLFKKSGIRLFARNIRGYLGESPDINEAMAGTVKKEPENFWYYNNGVTIVCDEAKREVESGSDVLRVERAQVINGQQTTRTLEKTPSRRASVLVKVIRIPRAGDDHANYEDLVSSIVRATNWQNPISPSDLISNDYIQVYLERELRKRGYQYLRKRESKSEARRRADAQIYFQVSKFEVAQAVVGSDFDPAIVRQGKEALFDERYYRSIFKSESVEFYLKRYWLLKIVSSVAYGRSREFKYAKWLAYNRVYDIVSQSLTSKDLALKFRNACERNNGRALTPLRDLIYTVFRAVIRFYRNNRGKGKDQTDWPTFVKASNQDSAFADYWRSREKARAKTVQRRLETFQRRISQIDPSF